MDDTHISPKSIDSDPTGPLSLLPLDTEPDNDISHY